MLDVDILKIDWDEGGCYLILSAEDGTLRVHLSDPEQAYDAVKAGIGPWLYERDQAKVEYEQYRRSGTGRAAAYFTPQTVTFHCDPDESAGLEEAWRDAADLQRKAAKENA